MKLSYIIIPLVAFAVAIFGSSLTSRGMSWYKNIKLPSWTPSGSTIGIVWTIIFILGAASALFVWNKGTVDNRLLWIAVLFGANAILNVLWSLIFFRLHFIGSSVIEAGLLALSVIGLIILIWPVSLVAALLLIPYAGWVCFATFLTFVVWNLNK